MNNKSENVAKVLIYNRELYKAWISVGKIIMRRKTRSLRTMYFVDDWEVERIDRFTHIEGPDLWKHSDIAEWLDLNL